MARSLSNPVDNFAERIDKIKCRDEYDKTKCGVFWIKWKDCVYCLEYIKVKNDLIVYRYLCYNENYQKIFMKT